MIKNIRSDNTIDQFTPKMLNWLQEASNNNKTFHLIKLFIENLENLIPTTNSPLYEWNLINNWLTKYLSTCYYNDLCKTFDIFTRIYDKVEKNGNWEEIYENFVYPALKLAGCASTSLPIVGYLAGKLSLASNNLMRDAFVYFNGDTIDINVSCTYLNVILDNYPLKLCLTQQDERICIQSWSRICILTNIMSDNVPNKRLTENILKFDVLSNYKQYLKCKPDPLIALMEYYNVNHRNMNDFTLYDIIFDKMDKFIQNYLSEPKKETIVYRIYTIISLAFLYCGNLLYLRHKSTSPLTRLVAILLLPTEFLMGKPLNSFVLNSIKKTWQIYFESLVKLNEFNDDLYLERTQRDLIVRYLPFFTQTDSPLLKCMENSQLASVILMKLDSVYFQKHTHESEKNVKKVLGFLKDFIQSTTSMDLLKLVVEKTLKGLFVVILFKNEQKNAAISVITSIVFNSLYPHVKDDFHKAIILITKEHLAFNTRNYFDLMQILVKFIPNDLKQWLDDVKQCLINVERLRGVECDRTLREPFEKLQKALN